MFNEIRFDWHFQYEVWKFNKNIVFFFSSKVLTEMKGYLKINTQENK